MKFKNVIALIFASLFVVMALVAAQHSFAIPKASDSTGSTESSASVPWKGPSENKAYPKWSEMRKPWIYVSLRQQKVYIHGNGKVQYVMNCSTGMPTSPTPTGTYHIQKERGYSFYNAKSHEGAHYWVSWHDHGVYLFHSVPTNKAGKYVVSEAEKLGVPVSHGCVRLSIPDAKWMYKTVPFGTKVVIH